MFLRAPWRDETEFIAAIKRQTECSSWVCVQVWFLAHERGNSRGKYGSEILELLFADARNTLKFGQCSRTTTGHFAKTSIGKNDVSGNVTRIGEFTTHFSQVLEKLLVALN